MAKARTKLDPAHVPLQLKITLLDIRPSIWRRLLVPAKIKLPQFHTALQRAFGWTNSHLHAFQIKDDSYEAFYPEDWSEDSYGPGQRRDEKKFRLCDLLQAKGDRLTYEYDFGDGWRHKIVVEKVLPGARSKVVTCLAGARACPPEDCGSIPGYYNLVEAMADPKHPEREELLTWLGEPFDPEAFNLETVNFLLGRIKL
jgi:hypothetical protein